jgi:hemolysin-activating ACP:hemolysin acyltransferase
MQNPTPVNARSNDPSAQNLKLTRSNSSLVALGMAVSFLMTKPVFAQLRFGDWSRILVGQINRGHYRFVTDDSNGVQGFIGWALTTKEKAENWAEGRSTISFEDSKEGECVVLNAWTANNQGVNRFLVNEARRIFKDKKTLYFKRYYRDGRVRPVRLNINEFVANHTKALEPQDEAAPILEIR